MMTSRQCLFHQVTGCEKDTLTDQCLYHCQKNSIIKTLKNSTIILDKKSGHYHSIYNNQNFLNTAITTDIKRMFDSFFIDLRDIQTETHVPEDKREVVQWFQNILEGKVQSETEIRRQIHPTTDRQYIKGI
jgi:putative protease